MRLTPARGLALVRRVDTEQTIPGGRILLAPQAIDRMTACQVELIAIGEPPICERPRKCLRRHGWDWPPGGILGGRAYHLPDERLIPGAWCIIRHRALIDTGDDTQRTYLCHHDDLLAVFSLTPETPPDASHALPPQHIATV